MRQRSRVALLLGLGGSLLLAAPPLRSQGLWTSIGPGGISIPNGDVISGPVGTLAVHPDDANVLYLGALDGGVWSSPDGGSHWLLLTPAGLEREVLDGSNPIYRLATLAVNTISLVSGSPDTLYVGTGAGRNNGAPLTGPPLGVFRSLDAGSTWEPLGDVRRDGCPGNAAMSRTPVYELVVAPDPPAAVIAATEVGIFRHLDDGSDCWQALNDGAPSGQPVTKLLRHPATGVFFAAIWSKGVYRSTDATGDRWVRLASGLPTTDFNRVSLAQAPSEPSALFAGFTVLPRTGGSELQLYRSSNAGDTWTALPTPLPQEAQLDYSQVLAIDPSNPDTLYLGTVSLWRADNPGAAGGVNDFGTNPPQTGKAWTNLSCCRSHRNGQRSGIDLHADIRALVFAPRGSFPSGTSQRDILFVATDGGLSKGVINDVDTVTWEPLTQGLSIGQCGTLGLLPGNPEATICGLWHNGNALTLNGGVSWMPVGGGDGFQTTLEVGSPTRPTTAYYNCNAFGGGAICRAQVDPAHVIPLVREETIWPDNNSLAHSSDPYFPGRLMRWNVAQNPAQSVQDPGVAFRTSSAAGQRADLLRMASSWSEFEPPGKNGNTSVVTAGVRTDVDDPVEFFLGTDAGEVWHARLSGISESPQWQRLYLFDTEVRQVAVDVQNSDRVVIALKSGSSLGRLQELVKNPFGTWDRFQMDLTFTPELRVSQFYAVAVDPFDSDLAFVGTDQGLYEVRRSGTGWVWDRVREVPPLHVTDLEVYQDVRLLASRAIRAATYGGSVFELRRGRRSSQVRSRQGLIGSRGTAGTARLVVGALRTDVDGASTSLTAAIAVTVDGQEQRRSVPIELSLPVGSEVSLGAPRRIRLPDESVEFQGWDVDGHASELVEPLTRIRLEADTVARAYYRLHERFRNPDAEPLRLSFQATVETRCQDVVSHEIALSWEGSGGQRPASVRLALSEVGGAGGHQGLELRGLRGSTTLLVAFPAGVALKVEATLSDWTGATFARSACLILPACPSS